MRSNHVQPSIVALCSLFAAGLYAAVPANADVTTATVTTNVNDGNVAVSSAHKGFSYSGSWTTSTGRSKYNSDDHYSAQRGSSFTFRFTGTQVVFFGAKAPHHGQASISIDGGAPVVVDQFSSSRKENQEVFRSARLPHGEHVATVLVTGTKQKASSGTVFSVDRAAVSSIVTSRAVNDATVDSTDGRFEYAGSWRTSTGVKKFQGDDHYSASAGSSVTFRFSGSNVSLFGAKAPHHGMATVSIDGGPPVVVDQYATSRAENVEFFRSESLPEGQHVAHVVVGGFKRFAAKGTTIGVDRAVTRSAEANPTSAPAPGDALQAPTATPTAGPVSPSPSVSEPTATPVAPSPSPSVSEPGATPVPAPAAPPQLLWSSDVSGGRSSFAAEKETGIPNAAVLTPAHSSSGPVLRVTYPAGSNYGYTGLARFHTPAGNTSGKSLGIVPQSEVVLRYKMYVPSSAQLTVPVKFPGVGGLPDHEDGWYTSAGGGKKPDSWSFRMHARPATEGGNGGIGRPFWTAYLYAEHANGTKFADNGTGGYGLNIPFRTSLKPDYTGDRSDFIAIPRDRWFEVKVRVKMNDQGQRNGIAEGWIDGVKGMSLTDVEWNAQGYQALVNQMMLSSFYNGSGAGSTSWIDFDDFALSSP